MPNESRAQLRTWNERQWIDYMRATQKKGKHAVTPTKHLAVTALKHFIPRSETITLSAQRILSAELPAYAPQPLRDLLALSRPGLLPDAFTQCMVWRSLLILSRADDTGHALQLLSEEVSDIPDYLLTQWLVSGPDRMRVFWPRAVAENPGKPALDLIRIAYALEMTEILTLALRTLERTDLDSLTQMEMLG